MDIMALLSVDSLVALLTLTALEIVLGIDNVIFIAVLSDRLPEAQRVSTRNIGLALAMVMRIMLLLTIFWVMRLTTPLFELPFGAATLQDSTGAVTTPLTISGRDLILIVGGLFLLAKSTFEIHHMMEGPDKSSTKGTGATVASVLTQIVLLDVVFSLDSVITAIGMTDHVWVMIVAVVVSVAVMIAFAGSVSRFVANHPSMKTLALSFLVMIGVLLVADGLGQHLPRGYVYFAMTFSLVVEFINLRVGARKSTAKVST